MKKILLASATLLTLVGTSFAQTPTVLSDGDLGTCTRPLTVGATITPLTLTITMHSQIDLGTITLANSQSVITLGTPTALAANAGEASSAISATGGASLTAATVISNGFIVGGQAATTYAVTFSAPSISLADQNAIGAPIVMNALTLGSWGQAEAVAATSVGARTLSNATTRSLLGQIPKTGDPASTTVFQDGFSIGGTLTVPANQVPGTYVGSVTVTVTYL